MRKNQITIQVLVFGSIFLIFLAGILGFLFLLHRQSLRKVAWNEALHIAEAGINYYRWHLQHFPDDLQDGNDWCCQSPPCSTCGPYEHSYQDPQQKVKGTFSLEIEGKVQCNKVMAVKITSTGWTEEFPEIKRKISINYIHSTVADYAYILNSNVWAGADREIKGPYHSNGGIRMDGENNSLVTSAKEEWICTSSFGCSPCPTSAGCYLEGTDCKCPGVFTTANGREELFRYPVPPFDFEGITVDLAEIRDLTANQGKGIYLPPSGGKGYHIILNGTFVKVYEINSLESVYSYSLEEGWHWEDSIIENETYLGEFSLSEECALVFVEDDLWIEGSVQGKVTIVSANLTTPFETNVWLPGNITYSTKDGSDGLFLVGQHNILISLNSPDNMELNGIFLAQTGHFGRNYYPCWLYPADCIKENLEIFGSIVSNKRVGTQWVYGWGGIASGYKKRENIYDPKQSYDPPPYLPFLSETYQFKNWQELP